MYRTAETGMKRRTAAAIIAAVMLAAGVLTACQPTPDAPVVGAKNDGQLEQKIQRSPAQETLATFQVPTHWNETQEFDKLTIVADTDIMIPDVTAYPVVKMARRSLTQQQIDGLVDYFAEGKKLYAWPSIYTKDDYAQQIIEAQRGVEVDGEYIVTEDTQKSVEELEKKYEEAPEDSQRVYIDTTLTYDGGLDGTVAYDTGQNYLSAAVENGNGGDALISAQNYAEGETNSTRFAYSKYNSYFTESDYCTGLLYGDEAEMGYDGYGEVFDNIDLDKDDARAQADKVLVDLGIDDMALVNEEKVALRSYDNLWGLVNDLPDKGGYVFEFMHQSGGLAGFQPTSWGGNSQEEPPDYSPPFDQERVTIAVSDEGVEIFYWDGLAQVVETVSENVTLLPFEDIQQNLIDQIRYKESFQLDGSVMTNYKVTVTSAELRTGYIGVKDNVKQALLVPIWVFKTEVSYYNALLEEEQTEYDDDAYMFNAIDGGVIKMGMPQMNY